MSGPSRSELSRSAAELVARLSALGRTIATAEATTGGLIGYLVTAVPGSSAVFRAGYAPYSNHAKVALGVDRDLLAQQGAVSREAAEALAIAARAAAGADIAVAETGIAGLGGGAPDRPVGLFWISVATGTRFTTKRFEFGHDRDGNRSACAQAAMELVLEAITEKR